MTRTESRKVVECSLSTVYALSLMKGVDPEELRYGQLLILAVGLSLVLTGHLLLSILFCPARKSDGALPVHFLKAFRKLVASAKPTRSAT